MNPTFLSPPLCKTIDINSISNVSRAITGSWSEERDTSDIGFEHYTSRLYFVRILKRHNVSSNINNVAILTVPRFFMGK